MTGDDGSNRSNSSLFTSRMWIRQIPVDGTVQFTPPTSLLQWNIDDLIQPDSWTPYGLYHLSNMDQIAESNNLIGIQKRTQKTHLILWSTMTSMISGSCLISYSFWWSNSFLISCFDDAIFQIFFPIGVADWFFPFFLKASWVSWKVF